LLNESSKLYAQLDDTPKQLEAVSDIARVFDILGDTNARNSMATEWKQLKTEWQYIKPGQAKDWLEELMTMGRWMAAT